MDSNIIDGIEVLDDPSLLSSRTRRTTSSRNKRRAQAETPPDRLQSDTVEEEREKLSTPRPKKRAPAQVVKGVTAAQRESVKGLFAVTLGLADWTVYSLRPDIWTEADRLKDYEGKLLVDGLWAEVSLHPKAVEWLLKTANQSGHAQLAGALLCVSLPRLANHGLLPPEFAKMASYFALQLATLGANSFPMESRPAPNGNSGDGAGEVNTNGVASPTTEVQDSTPLEARRSGMENGTNGSARTILENRQVR